VTAVRGLERTAFANTIADLRSMPVTLGLVNNLIYVMGALAVGDGGGGFYLCTQTNPGTDNGTSRVASATSGFYFERMVRNAVSRFFASNGTTAVANATGDGTAATVAFGTVTYDHNADFATPSFTAPVKGVYAFKAAVNLTGIGAAHTGGLLQLTGTPRYSRLLFNPAALRDVNNSASVLISSDIELDAAETCGVEVVVSGGTKTVGIGTGSSTIHVTYFAGQLAP
jgi:hypothetical protein